MSWSQPSRASERQTRKINNCNLDCCTLSGVGGREGGWAGESASVNRMQQTGRGGGGGVGVGQKWSKATGSRLVQSSTAAQAKVTTCLASELSCRGCLSAQSICKSQKSCILRALKLGTGCQPRSWLLMGSGRMRS